MGNVAAICSLQLDSLCPLPGAFGHIYKYAVSASYYGWYRQTRILSERRCEYQCSRKDTATNHSVHLLGVSFASQVPDASIAMLVRWTGLTYFQSLAFSVWNKAKTGIVRVDYNARCEISIVVRARVRGELKFAQNLRR